MIFQIYGRNTFTTTEFCQPTHQPTLADLTCKWVSKCQLRAFYMRPGIPTLKGLIISRWLDLAPWHQALRHATNFSAPNMCTQWWHSAMATQKCLVAGSKNFPLHIFTWLKTFSWLFCHLGWIPALFFGREFGIPFRIWESLSTNFRVFLFQVVCGEGHVMDEHLRECHFWLRIWKKDRNQKSWKTI